MSGSGFLLFAFALLLRAGAPFIAFSLARWGEFFGFEALVLLLCHPGIELLLECGFDWSQRGIGGEVFGFVGVGLQVVEFFGGAVKEVSDTSGERGIVFRVGLPGFDGLALVDAADGVGAIRREVAESL